MGERLLIDEGNRLYSMEGSACANIIGSSTLAITKDRYLIIGEQGMSSAANPGRLAPTGSGSVDYADCFERKGILFRKSKDLIKVVVRAAERELLEECGFSKARGLPFMETWVIGYARLLERGGKPDFFSITYLDSTWNQVKELRPALSERGLVSSLHEIKVEGDKTPTDVLGQYLDKKKCQPGEPAVSIQLAIIYKELEAIREHEGHDPLEKLMELYAD